MPMFTRIWSKNDTQGFVKRLREAGYTVEKLDGGYVCHNETPRGGLDLVFQAMIGSRGYLCRLNSDYVETENTIPMAV